MPKTVLKVSTLSAPETKGAVPSLARPSLARGCAVPGWDISGHCPIAGRRDRSYSYTARLPPPPFPCDIRDFSFTSPKRKCLLIYALENNQLLSCRPSPRRCHPRVSKSPAWAVVPFHRQGRAAECLQSPTLQPQKAKKTSIQERCGPSRVASERATEGQGPGWGRVQNASGPIAMQVRWQDGGLRGGLGTPPGHMIQVSGARGHCRRLQRAAGQGPQEPNHAHDSWRRRCTPSPPKEKQARGGAAEPASPSTHTGSFHEVHTLGKSRSKRSGGQESWGLVVGPLLCGSMSVAGGVRTGSLSLAEPHPPQLQETPQKVQGPPVFSWSRPGGPLSP